MRYFILFFCVISLSYCKNTHKPPSNLIEAAELIPVLKDIHLLEGSKQNDLRILGDSIPASLLVEYKEIFAEYDVNADDFADSYAYYAKYETERLIEVYDSLLIELQDMEGKLGEVRNVQPKKTTTDITKQNQTRNPQPDKYNQSRSTNE